MKLLEPCLSQTIQHLTVLYHKNCTDGAASMAVVNLLAQRHDFKVLPIAVQYGDPIPDISGDVLIVDFSYPKVQLLELNNRTDITSLLVIDHHRTAEQELAGLDFCIFDMQRCGATLTWQTFFPDTPVPEFLEYVEDRDIWKWEKENSKEFHAGLRSYPMDIDIWTCWLDGNSIWDVVERTLISEGSAILRYQSTCIESEKAKDHRMVEIAGHKVPYFPCTHLVSEVGNAMAADYPFVVMWFETPTERIHSLRSLKGKVDVSEIAKMFPGGGGHSCSAGFKLSIEEAQKRFHP